MEPIRIALADDHTIVRKSIIAMLGGDERFAIVADEAEGAALLRAIAALPQPPQVCLLDMQMPVMDGHDTLIALKKLLPEAHAIVLSQYDDEFAIIRMLKAGAHGFLHKDAEPAELKEAIITVATGAYFHNRLVTKRMDALLTRGGYEPQRSLSASELLFLRYILTELSYDVIAGELGVTKRTAEGIRARLFDKFDVKTRTGLALHVLRMGLLPPKGFDK